MPNRTALNFTSADNDLAYKLYKDLIAQGVPLTDMDVGEGAINYTGKTCPNGASTCLIGTGDGIVTSSEVFEYALNNYEKYQKLIEGVTGDPLPWVLDDLDPKTVFDEQVRKKVEEGITQLKEILSAQKITGDEYDEKLAVGLFYLAVTPSLEILKIKENEEYFNGSTRELETIGLGRYYDYLRTKGFYFIKQNYSEELTALQAIERSHGKCTEVSMILFAILRMAGLKPKFVQVPRDALKKEPSLQQYVKSLPSGQYHICVGLQMNERFRLFDPAVNNSNADYDEYGSLTLRQGLSVHYSNRGNSWRRKGDWDKAIENYTTAIRINPESADAYTGRCATWSGGKGDENEAIADCTEAIRIDPKNASAYNNRGIAWVGKGESNKAIADYKEAIKIDPEIPETYANLGLALVAIGELEKAIQSLVQFLKFLPEKTDILFPLLSKRSDSRWNQNPDSKKTAAMFAQEMGGGDIAKVEAIFILSYSLWEAGNREEAIPRLKTISDGVNFTQKPSQSTQAFFENMFALMPPAMAKDQAVQTAVAEIKAKLK